MHMLVRSNEPEIHSPQMVWESPTQVNPETGMGRWNGETLHLQLHGLCEQANGMLISANIYCQNVKYLHNSLN